MIGLQEKRKSQLQLTLLIGTIRRDHGLRHCQVVLFSSVPPGEKEKYYLLKIFFFSLARTMPNKAWGQPWESRQQITSENRRRVLVVHCADSVLQIRRCLRASRPTLFLTTLAFAFLLVCQMKFLSKKNQYILYIYTHTLPTFLSRRADCSIQASFRSCRTGLKCQALGF